jgi:hypothetical protein
MLPLPPQLLSSKKMEGFWENKPLYTVGGKQTFKSLWKSTQIFLQKIKNRASI